MKSSEFDLTNWLEGKKKEFLSRIPEGLSKQKFYNENQSEFRRELKKEAEVLLGHKIKDLSSEDQQIFDFVTSELKEACLDWTKNQISVPDVSLFISENPAPKYQLWLTTDTTRQYFYGKDGWKSASELQNYPPKEFGPQELLELYKEVLNDAQIPDLRYAKVLKIIPVA